MKETEMRLPARGSAREVRIVFRCLPVGLLAWRALGGPPLAAQPLRWVPLGPRGGWVQTLAPVPASAGMVWAGVPDLGVWRSVDGGASWVEAGALAVQHGNGGRSRAVVADPVDPLTVYAATAGGLAKSV